MPVSTLVQKAKRLLRGTLKHAGTAALAAALVPLGAVAVSAQNTSRVDGTVTGTAPNLLYEFDVFNTTTIDSIVDWELPLFDAGDVSNIQSPFGWTFEIVSPFDDPPSIWDYDAATDPLLDLLQGGDPDLYGDNPSVLNEPPLVLHWFTSGEVFNPIDPNESLSGFSFESEFNQQNAPYLTSWDELPPVGGDPPIPPGFGTPNSPARQAAQAAIPEPASFAIWGSILIGVGAGMNWRRRRNEKSLAFVVDTDGVDC